ncbi:D-glycero-beta-D-manno-heptose 1,7-bisphosphate 7-phosphatase [Methyloglobulus sp.]|uniref:D-glycero-beta-D-manno-heptose 1,7-bisphosphate 7-phosphatase n=1 Tax=Methyloglobulus sp. TaxID=2518622 RepID=UPI003988FFA3
MKQRRYVLMDRDGVINYDSEDFIKCPEEWRPIEGSLEGIALLNKRGYEVVVITNQSGLARGLLDESMLANIHEKMHQMLAEKGGAIAAIYYCPHGQDSLCNCRKPKPGLFERFALEKNVDLSGVHFIGDSLRDIQAALVVGAIPLLVKTGKGQKTLINNPNLNIPVFENLYAAVQHILSE